MNTEQKIDAIYKNVNEIRQYMAGNDVRVEQLQEVTKKHTTQIEEHSANQQRFFGGITILGLMATAFFSWLFKSIH